MWVAFHILRRWWAKSSVILYISRYRCVYLDQRRCNIGSVLVAPFFLPVTYATVLRHLTQECTERKLDTLDYKLAVLVYKCLHGLAPSYLADELHHRRVGVSKASAFRFVLWTVYSPYPTLKPRRPSISSGRCADLEVGTVFRSISHLLLHFLFSALAWRHTSSNSVSRNYCCRGSEVTLSFMDTLIALTYLPTLLFIVCLGTLCLGTLTRIFRILSVSLSGKFVYMISWAPTPSRI